MPRRAARQSCPPGGWRRSIRAVWIVSSPAVEASIRAATAEGSRVTLVPAETCRSCAPVLQTSTQTVCGSQPDISVRGIQLPVMVAEPSAPRVICPLFGNCSSLEPICIVPPETGVPSR